VVARIATVSSDETVTLINESKEVKSAGEHLLRHKNFTKVCECVSQNPVP